MTTTLVDTHCHFDLFPDPRAVLAATERQGIYSIAVTNTPSVFPAMKMLTEGMKYVRPALGLHPELAIQRAAELPLFARYLAETRYVGEIGLDYKAAVKQEDRKEQRSIFAMILRSCADAGGRVLTVHSRRAEADVVAAIADHAPGPFILHWYSGPLHIARAALEAGAYFSFNPAMATSPRGHRLLSEIPRDRVLTESDGPFVRYEDTVASPAAVSFVCRQIANSWRVAASDATALIRSNFRRLLESLPRAAAPWPE